MPREQREYLEPERFASAPKLPTDRAPTKREVWERELYLYEGILTRDEIVSRAKRRYQEYLAEGRAPSVTSDECGTLPKKDPKGAWHECTGGTDRPR